MSDSPEDEVPFTDPPTQEIPSEFGDDDSLEFDEPIQNADSPSGITVPDQLGDYVLKGVIGTGGMGQVYLAEHVRMQREVAVKMLRGDRMNDETAIERFYEEVRAVSRLMHPNIVAAFDAGEDHGIHYLTMEYVDGNTLTEILTENGPLSVGEAASVIRQAGLGLLHAHRAGIVHRDVKPGNIMRSSDGTIKVLDLGLAQISAAYASMQADREASKSSISEKGKLIGTLAYMSPEQLESPQDADPRSDIYSLGALLHFLLTGRPPYMGEYLDQVYGHRHGEIPDLMQVRDDVDLRFANIFRRMMAKSPDERYASLDEVIDELADYTDTTSAPLWLAEFTQRQTRGEGSTFSGGSTEGSTSEVLAIDFGMFYSAAAVATPNGEVNSLPAGGVSESQPGEKQALFRMAIASDDAYQLTFGGAAMQMRSSHPKQVVHCLPMYIGKDVVDREVCGRKCPPEVLLAMMFKRLAKNAWQQKLMPEAAAITVPASYDQLHRMSILQAAQMAGLRSVRLVDRGVAALQSLLLDRDEETSDLGSKADALKVDEPSDERILFISITGQASEVSVVQRESMRLQQLANAGHWHTGTLAWLHRLVDLAADTFVERYNVDPRKSLKTALPLQIACERAMNSLLLLPLVKITIDIGSESKSVSIHRRHWLERTTDLISHVKKNLHDVCERSGVSLDELDTCVTLGPLLRIPEVRRELLGAFEDSLEIKTVDRAEVARGAASCLAGELPGRGDVVMPPRCVTTQSLGIVVEDAKRRRRILPIIPRGTVLPARTNRRLTAGKGKDSMRLSLVESSGVDSEDWQSLGRYEFDVGDKNRQSSTRMIGFELNVNGMLTCRAQTPGQPGSVKLETLPKPMISEEELVRWQEWINAQSI